MAKTIKLIIGSTRQNRIAPAIAAWVEKNAAQADVNLEVVDLKEVNLPAFDAPVPPAYAPTTTDDGKKWAEIVGSADAFVFLTAEYNRSIPGALKNAIDYLTAEWKEKPAAIVSYGYVDGGKSATTHLSDILGWHKMHIVEPTVGLQLTQDMFNEDGSFKNVYEAFTANSEMLTEALNQLSAVDQPVQA